mmetsp:Transcript_11972/g.21476  ORF Transcript_11972/g.21476 Transcript_11972/m.21476 type:complete len:122 (-) Transcript_11972:447-812(-)|eukprot:CAMPEP_0175059520 /NCGR_PEP_ID=MMETSP0052_2-20121109/12479_1 /TAXON_ID=51329 ORGANISM="Polytomella parva, Strain SAG 63-3" /NCGR_SAMPLE_ID=MMETSP0052_2 /ASSEMBLY_ACC=CAM_ASM_000194 /LENGTH=121 /DNA_ID=CAMNT_0016325081 /DNA_START=40 /DNA_END=405 /DNA_ORIENTATION=+
MTWPKPINPYDVPSSPAYHRLQEPSYPVIDKDPDFWTAVSNVRKEEWGTTAAVAAGTFVMGYYLGAKGHTGKASAYFTSFLATKSITLYHAYNSANRLMGFKENSREVVKNVPAALVPEHY